MTIYIWENEISKIVLAVIAGSVADAIKLAEQDGIKVEGEPQRVISLVEPTPAIVVYSGEKNE